MGFGGTTSAPRAQCSGLVLSAYVSTGIIAFVLLLNLLFPPAFYRLVRRSAKSANQLYALKVECLVIFVVGLSLAYKAAQNPSSAKAVSFARDVTIKINRTVAAQAIPSPQKLSAPKAK